MERLLGAGVLAMIAASAVVGVRLLLLSRRTRQSPELLLGLAFVLLGVVGYPLAILARGGPGGQPSPGLLLVALAFQDLACLAMYASTRRTFHPTVLATRSLCVLVGVGFAASLTGGALSGEPDAGPWYYLGFSLRSGAFAWAAAESFGMWRKLRRRDALDLGDPIVTNRFGLWCTATIGIAAGFAIFLLGRLFTENVGAEPWVLASTSIVSLVSAVSMWLAFVPSPRYVRWIEGRAPGAGRGH